MSPISLVCRRHRVETHGWLYCYISWLTEQFLVTKNQCKKRTNILSDLNKAFISLTWFEATQKFLSKLGFPHVMCFIACVDACKKTIGIARVSRECKFSWYLIKKHRLSTSSLSMRSQSRSTEFKTTA